MVKLFLTSRIKISLVKCAQAPQHSHPVASEVVGQQQQERLSTTGNVENRLSTGSVEKSAAVLSPFDEKEEWNKISKIIDSFGADIGTDVKKSTTPNNCKF